MKKYKEEKWEISVNKSICAFVQKSMQPEEEDPSEESLFILERKRRKYLMNHFTWDTWHQIQVLLIVWGKNCIKKPIHQV